MAVFSLSSDNYFIRASADTKDDPDFFVDEYLCDPYDMAIVRRDGLSNEWGPRVRVGPSKQAKFSALEVFGVTIHGKQWSDLANDLKLPGADGEMFRLLANRRGLCFLSRVRTMSFSVLRINDCFGWSRYGVKVPELTSANVCNKCDIYSYATVVDVRGTMLAVEGAKREAKESRKMLEEKEKELAVCKKELECTKETVKKSGQAESLSNKLAEEKEKEVERVKVESAVREKELELTKEAVKRGKEMELLLNKSVEEKEKEMEKMINLLIAERQQVAALKATLGTFIDGYE